MSDQVQDSIDAPDASTSLGSDAILFKPNPQLHEYLRLGGRITEYPRPSNPSTRIAELVAEYIAGGIK